MNAEREQCIQKRLAYFDSVRSLCLFVFLPVRWDQHNTTVFLSRYDGPSARSASDGHTIFNNSHAPRHSTSSVC